MNLTSSTDISKQIISKAKALGASLARIFNIELLKNSPSCEVYNKSPYFDGCEKIEWRAEARSVVLCDLQLTENEAKRVDLKKSEDGEVLRYCVKYCRACELACPVARRL